MDNYEITQGLCFTLIVFLFLHFYIFFAMTQSSSNISWWSTRLISSSDPLTEKCSGVYF